MKTFSFKIAVFAIIISISFSCSIKEDNLFDEMDGKSVLKSDVVDSDFFYNDEGKKESFSIRNDRVVIKTKSESDTKSLIDKDIFLETHSDGSHWVIATIDPSKTKLEDLMEISEIVDVSYALEYEEGTLHFPTDQITVKCKEGRTLEMVLESNGLSKNVVEVELFNPLTELYLITLNVKLSDILRISRDLFKSGMCIPCPSFIRIIKPHNPYFSSQWGLKNTGQYSGTIGMDINAVQAWGTTIGSATIKVAVIDEGVDLTHPDLQSNLLTGYDAVKHFPGGSNGSHKGDDAHGTACAGIIAAIDNTVGIVGVAPNVKIIPIRIGYDTPSGWYTLDPWIADGITHAWNTAKADVLSNSWGMGAWSQPVADAINNAVLNGRNGSGCVVVFSAGNENKPTLYFPANLSNVITVGATSQCGTRKRSSSNWLECGLGVSPDPLGVSCDGEKGWGSNYGDALDLVAPGVKIYTTDIQGNAGYNTSNGTAGNYISNFNGTSAACPFVAGVAALVLSQNPSYTQSKVRGAIESRCTKLPGYTYTSNPAHPNDTWNTQVGHGLLNAHAALNPNYQMVLPTISGPDLLPCTGGRYSLNSNYVGIWSVPAGVTITSGQGTGKIDVTVSNANVIGAISVVVTNTANTISTITKNINIGARAVTSLSASSNSTYVGSSVFFSASPQFPSTEGDYNWSVPSGAYMSGYRHSMDISFSYSGYFTVRVGSYSSCSTQSPEVTASVQVN